MSPRRRALALAALLGAILVLAFAAEAQAAAPSWKLTVTPAGDYFVPGTVFGSEHPAVYVVRAENVGESITTGEVRFKDLLPSPLVPLQVFFFDTETGTFTGVVTNDDLHGALCPKLLECSFPGSLEARGIHGLKPGESLILAILAQVPEGTEGTLTDSAKVSGGGAASVSAEAQTPVSADPPFGVFHTGASALDSSGLQPYTQAGGHPFQFTTTFAYGSFSGPWDGAISALDWDTSATHTIRDMRETFAELPPGLLADPQAVPTCALAEYFTSSCSRRKDRVGTAGVAYVGSTSWTKGVLSGSSGSVEPLYNLQPNGAYPGELGFTVLNLPFGLITTGLRTGSDYGLDAVAFAPEADVNEVLIELWGVPAESSHDGQREGPAEYSPAPFVIMPTACTGDPLTIASRYNSWQAPGEYAGSSSDLPPLDGCNQLSFEPTIAARPTTDLADAPSGLEFDLHVPQHEGVEEDVTPSLHEALVKLPAGLTVNPSSGNGLKGCGPAQIGLATAVGETPAHFTESPAACPEASAIGTAEVDTPLLHNPLKGVVYLATPHQNPFASLLAAYIVLEGEGLIIKLPGEIEADPASGQLTGKFLENPQTPFEDFHLDFFGGARGDLRTPPTCGAYQTTSTLTPFSAPESGPPAEPSAEFELENGGAPCPRRASSAPNAPAFRAGTESPQAGAFTPFSFRLAREDGSQEISKIETTLPPGLVGKLAGVAECSDAGLALAASREHEGGGAEEQASPACPASSEVGTVQVGAGAGPTPLYVTGKAYLAGPYEGAPLSLAIITPAIAGPFDLGDVVVRTALEVNPETAQITAVSDPIPHILDGIPLDVRSITLKMDRPDFTLNPTDCSEFKLTGTETSVQGAVAPLSQRFQVGSCAALPFRPNLKISLKGSTRHGGHPGLRAVLTYPKGGPYANVARAQVNLPHSEFIDQGNLDKVCTRPVLLEGACPARTIYGKAKAWTPLLEAPLEGPVYLVGGFGYKLPALVAELDGQIRVLLVGKVDSGKNKGIRNTFEAVPDAPVEKFELRMKGGKKYSLLENSEDLCASPQKAIARFTGQNGKVLALHPKVANQCGRKKKGKKHHKKHGQHHGAHGKAGHHGASRLAALLSRGW